MILIYNDGDTTTATTTANDNDNNDHNHNKCIKECNNSDDDFINNDKFTVILLVEERSLLKIKEMG